LVAMWREPMVGGNAIHPYSLPLHPEPRSGGSSPGGGNRIVRQNHHPVRTASFKHVTRIVCHLMAFEKIQVFLLCEDMRPPKKSRPYGPHPVVSARHHVLPHVATKSRRSAAE
jgi:hypothetical protein